jgi:hypothetical protein
MKRMHQCADPVRILATLIALQDRYHFPGRSIYEKRLPLRPAIDLARASVAGW